MNDKDILFTITIVGIMISVTSGLLSQIGSSSFETEDGKKKLTLVGKGLVLTTVITGCISLAALLVEKSIERADAAKAVLDQKRSQSAALTPIGLPTVTANFSVNCNGAGFSDSCKFIFSKLDANGSFDSDETPWLLWPSLDPKSPKCHEGDLADCPISIDRFSSDIWFDMLIFESDNDLQKYLYQGAENSYNAKLQVRVMNNEYHGENGMYSNGKWPLPMLVTADKDSITLSVHYRAASNWYYNDGNIVSMLDLPASYILIIAPYDSNPLSDLTLTSFEIENDGGQSFTLNSTDCKVVKVNNR